MFHVKQNLKNNLLNREAFQLTGFDYRLLPLLLPSIPGKTLLVFDDEIVDCYDNLSLFLEDRGVFVNKDLLSGGVAPRGFSGWAGEEKKRFLSSLASGFSNHTFVVLPFSLYNRPVFPKHKTLKEIVINKKTSYDELLLVLSQLDYSKEDYVSSPGDFAVRGLVIDFFPFDYSSGIRCVFDGGCLELYSFNVLNQITICPLSSFVLVKSRRVKNFALISSFFKEAFSVCYIYKTCVSFNSLSPEKAYKTNLVTLSALECSSFKGLYVETEDLCVVGYLYKEKTYIPRWFGQKEGGGSLLSDVYVDFSSLSVGDYLIHEDFGVGKYLGLVEEEGFESLLLKFLDAKVKVSPKYFNKISFFKNSFSFCSLDRVGSRVSWKNKIARVKKNSSFFVEALIKNHIDRQRASSDDYYLDEELESSFLKGFVFKDTYDQSTAWKEIKKDLLMGAPMDRLLCGDVGFGKTELALRAVFVSGINGFGSLVLAPTTILAKQLYGSFVERLSPYGLSVGYVSRFIKKSSHEILFKDFLTNKLDVLVGTHSIINNKECLKKASLVIVDDEHRFGVKQKDGVKEINSKVNVLYMSATPIPRTLKLALSKFKSLSILSSPPSFKRPTKTYVDFFSFQTIKRAILFELARNGQVLFIHNNIKTMRRAVSYIKELAPFASVDFLHGQELPSKVEKKMDSFINKKTSVLVASSIIECGIDLPNVNTIIINNSHLFGVSQLYQMRGRVGRSFRSSFAYLLVPKKVSLSPLAKRRLQTIEKNSALGSCYSVSMEDLNLRGAGSLFGFKQSGGADIVGLDLYSKILQDLVDVYYKKELFASPVISSSIKAFIPFSFLPSAKMRVWFYKELSQTSLGSLDSFVKKAVNLFGPFPLFLNNLVGLRRVFLLSTKLFFSRVSFNPGSVVVFPFLSFWRGNHFFLAESLAVLEISFVEGGEGFEIPCHDDKFFILFDKIYNRLQHVL